MGDEFGVQYNFIGNGDEYQRLEAIKNSGGALIIPLDFPEAYDVSDPYLARMIGLDELRHWELAPSNPGLLVDAGIQVTFTAEGLKDPGMLIGQVRKAIDAGLSEEDALRALTATPASLVGMEDMVGTLRNGMLANFILTSGPLFNEGSKIVENWVQGEQYIIIDRSIPDLSGEYSLTSNDKSLNLKVIGEPGKHKGSFEVITQGKEGADTVMVKVKIKQEGEMIGLQFGPTEGVFDGTYRLNGNAFKGLIWKGKGENPSGEWIEWAAVKDNEVEKPKEAKRSALASERTDTLVTNIPEITYPFVAYGWKEQPAQEILLISNATIWTCEEDGIIENGQLLIADGKIKAVGQTIDLNALYGRTLPDIVQYDAQGAHLTPGIIDEHSHIAISRGVNEGTQASSAEVSIASVVNSEDVNIYRQLSGGVTAAQLLHGSANPIGGQSGIIKMRWGSTPEEMLIETDAPFIKFALGENVKQSNWGEYYRSRFPQTRMGVEQVFYDHFIRAREYGEAWDVYEEEMATLTRRQRRKGGFPTAPRRDLELETLLQIIESERFVSCHSYRQDEINMLMHVADSMGFTLNTFTHILEGYKVADKMFEHGAGGSSFSDWWAYKFEVKDAIPHNGAILWEQGVITAFNSDDAEMARRLNQEAAKAVKYGGVPEEEALKFVTLNPAKLLHLDDRMGSIKVGKDADFVIWTDHPLSIYAQARMTFVDGRRLYDQERDQVLRQEMREERARLVQQMLNAGGEGKKKPMERVPHRYHCDSATEEIR
ncbi:MAG: amidohydrolase family protein [Flavobacteriales bacterium]|nr:amidohydrolase family protein [Flavobacteriales bacterium]